MNWRRCLQCYHNRVLSFTEIMIRQIMLVVFLLAICTAGQYNCDRCNVDNIMCDICHTGYTANVTGVCRGIVFAHTILFTASVSYSFIFLLRMWVFLERSMSTKYEFSGFVAVLKSYYVKIILLLVRIEAVVLFLWEMLDFQWKNCVAVRSYYQSTRINCIICGWMLPKGVELMCEWISVTKK